MRAHEFLTETVAKTHSHHEAAQRSFTRSRDPGGYYPTYHQYRTGLALAMANGTGEPIDVDHETIVGPFWSYHPYTEEEYNMFIQAEKVIPTEKETMLPWSKSKEPEDTNTTSLAKPFKGYKKK